MILKPPSQPTKIKSKNYNVNVVDLIKITKCDTPRKDDPNTYYTITFLFIDGDMTTWEFDGYAECANIFYRLEKVLYIDY